MFSPPNNQSITSSIQLYHDESLYYVVPMQSQGREGMVLDMVLLGR